MTTEQVPIQAKANIIKSLEEEVKPTHFSIKQLLAEYSPQLTIVGSIVGSVIAILALMGNIHRDISTLNSRLGNVEGKLELLLEDRKEILDSYKEASSSSSVQQE